MSVILFWITVVSFSISFFIIIFMSLFFYYVKKDGDKFINDPDIQELLDKLDKAADKFNEEHPQFDYQITGIDVLKVLTTGLMIPYLNVVILILSSIRSVYKKLMETKL